MIDATLHFSRMFYDEELDQSDRFYQKQPLVLQLCYALYNMLVAHSEMVCYLVIIINHMVSASCVTLVLPITIFLWAMLSVPRPSKRYWMTAIIYTEVRSPHSTLFNRNNVLKEGKKNIHSCLPRSLSSSSTSSSLVSSLSTRTR